MYNIPDSLIDSFFGEYERPGANKSIVCECSGCDRDIRGCDDVIITGDGIFCADCANEIIDDFFEGLTLREKADILNFNFCEAKEAVSV